MVSGHLGAVGSLNLSELWYSSCSMSGLLRGAQSWAKNWGLEPQAPACEGSRPELSSRWGLIGEGPPYRGWLTFLASLVQEDAAPSPLPALDLFRQLRQRLEMDQILDLTKMKTNLAAPAKPSTPTPTHLSRAPQLQKPRLSAWAAGWRVVVAMVTMQASGSCSWRGGFPQGPAWVSVTAPSIWSLFSLGSEWQV